MLENGKVMFDRKMLSWRWYKDDATFKLFFHLIMTVNWKDSQFEEITIKRGQRIASLGILSEETGLSLQSLRTALKHLKKTGEVTYTSYSKYSVFSVLNYDVLQTANKQLTSNQQAGNKQLTSNQQHLNKDNKYNKDNYYPHPLSPSPQVRDKRDDEDDEKQNKKENASLREQKSNEFMKFWNTYPKAFNIEATYTEWLRQAHDIGEKKLLDIILPVMSEQTKSHNWRKENGRYIPRSEKYLADRRFEDRTVQSEKYDKYEDDPFEICSPIFSKRNGDKDDA